jgi:hypothetical protein
MEYMFTGGTCQTATIFDQDISMWNVSKVDVQGGYPGPRPNFFDMYSSSTWVEAEKPKWNY